MPFSFGKKPTTTPTSVDISALAAAFPKDDHLSGTGSWTTRDAKGLLGLDLPSFTGFISEQAGASFGGGLLRILAPDTRPSLLDWNRRDGWHHDWPSVPAAKVFASDWLGRLYLLDPARRPDGQPRVALLDPATGEYEVIDHSFDELIEEIWPTAGHDLFDVDRFDAWQQTGGRVPGLDECVAYAIPLPLGGTPDLSNMEVLFLNVWISISGQIFEQTKGMPPGTRVSGVTSAGG
jgi:hypothetical protein